MKSTFQQRMNNPFAAWSLVLLLVVAIYGTLYWARPVCEYLRRTTPLGGLITILLLSVTGLLVWVFFKRNVFKTPLHIFLFALVLSVYAISCFSLEHPEERLHFLEYGLLTLFSFKALRYHVSRPGLYAAAWLLVSLLGYGDELIQYYLPNRYFQWQDVGLNSLSAVLALALIGLLDHSPVSRSRL